MKPHQQRTVSRVAFGLVCLVHTVTIAACTQGGTPGRVDHGRMIQADGSRVGGSANGPGLPHSHILSERGGGWFHTVNIRVRDINAWNAIAEAKTLEKVRERQADPVFGGKGLVSQDTPTNIFFFIASWR